MAGTRVNETGTAKSLGANGSYVTGPNAILVQFLCVTAGTITVTDSASNVLLNGMPVAAGQGLALAMECPIGVTVQLGGGCVGTLVVSG